MRGFLSAVPVTSLMRRSLIGKNCNSNYKNDTYILSYPHLEQQLGKKKIKPLGYFLI